MPGRTGDPAFMKTMQREREREREREALHDTNNVYCRQNTAYSIVLKNAR